MATDRIDDLDSSREITDRVGGTVILGNAVDSKPIEIIAAAAMTMGTESDADVPFNIAASLTAELTNGSFGIWAVDFDIDGTGALTSEGAAIAASPLSALAAALMTWGADGMLLNIQVFTATGTYTPTSGTAQIVVHCLGGGGGGGGCGATSSDYAVGGGGGAGGYGMARITSGFSGQTVTVGAGGAGGAAGANNGSSGGATSFGTLLIAGGGSGGVGAVSGALPRASGGGSGGAVSGTASLFGAQGAPGVEGKAFAGTVVDKGHGASTIYGAGGVGRILSGGSETGTAATGFGSGGGGAGSQGTASSAAGGAGAPGLVIIFEYNA